MYFPFGWPKYLKTGENESVKYLCCNRDRSLFTVLSDSCITIWYAKPWVQLVCHTRSQDSLASLGANQIAEWKPDSSHFVITTSQSHLLFYQLDIDDTIKGLYEQQDSKVSGLKRESSELFMKEKIPPVIFSQVNSTFLPGGIAGVTGIRDELMVSTCNSQVWRVGWDGAVCQEFCWDLYSIPFSIDQHLSRGSTLEGDGLYVRDMEYSPLIGGFSVVLSNGKAGFVTGASLRFDPGQIQGIWAQEVSCATCTAVNHRYRLIVYGLKSADGAVYCVDDLTGALQLVHRLVLSSKDFPDVASAAGAVKCLKWSPDGAAIALSWEQGGISVWSVFGILLMCTLGWDYGVNNVLRKNPFCITSMDWGMEGYHIWMTSSDPSNESKIVVLQFAKSSLTVNAGMTGREHVFLQAEDRLFIGVGSDIPQTGHPIGYPLPDNDDDSDSHTDPQKTRLAGKKQWIVVPIPYNYLGNNWPIRYATLDASAQHIAVAGRTGLAHYSIALRKWKLFGNESQEQDFVVMGGLLWWQDHVIMGCYNLKDCRDEIRLYPKEAKLDNQFVRVVKVPTQVLQLSLLGDRLLCFCADSYLTLYQLSRKGQPGPSLQLTKQLEVDVSSLVIHPACVVSAILSSLRTETGKRVDSVLMNVCGKLFLLQQDPAQKALDARNNNQSIPMFSAPTVLASSVENQWVSSRTSHSTPHLTEALWISCGAHGMRVWLPLFPKDGENARSHNFMSKRIMLPIQVPIYPLAVLFEETMVLGAENDTIFCTVDSSVTSPLSIISRSSQVYLHHILRQLLRRNLGYHAWEVARSCSCLSYFPHSLELLLHEVLEEEATSSEPIPDALLPRVIDFIREFPVYLQTIVQCARKTELALWPYLFAAVGNPRHLFQECLQQNKLDTAASYLIILQSLEVCSVSRQFATLLLDATLDAAKWELSKDLVRFLRAIDPSDAESPPRMASSGKLSFSHPPPPAINTTAEDLSLVLGTVSLTRGRSFSSGGVSKVLPQPTNDPLPQGGFWEGGKKSEPKVVPLKRKVSSGSRESGTAEEFFIDTILTRHARKLLSIGSLKDLGSYAAHLDFHLVGFLTKERSRAARIEDFVAALRKTHLDFQWPFPALPVAHALNLHKYYTGSQSGTPTEGHLKQPMSFNGSLEIRDSGYLSNLSLDPLEKLSEGSLKGIPEGHAAIEAHLLPRSLAEDENVLTLDVSEGSSLWGEESHSTLDEHSLPADFEALTLELASRGPPEAEVQLRYLQQLLLEAGCLDWALVLGVVLRDPTTLARAVNASQQPDLPSDIAQHLRNGLAALEYWADVECLGYKPFMVSIRNQMKTLAKMTIAQRAMLKLHSQSSAENSYSQEEGETGSTASETPPLDGLSREEDLVEDSGDVFLDTRNDMPTKTDAKDKQENSGSDCVVS